MRLLYFILGTLLLILLPGIAWCQDSLRTNTLSEVVVTGQFEPQSAMKSVYQVRTISMERIQSQGATRLQDVLNNELNIRFSQDLALGGSNLTMQGLAGQNVKVLLDGVPLTGRQGTGNEININQININNIERIEIVEGPMSVVYGADALAGVINIITRKPGDEKASVYARVHEETVGEEYGASEGIHNEAAGFTWQRSGIQLAIDGGRNDFNGWQGDAAERDKEWYPKTQWFGSVMSGYKKENINVYYRLDALHETIENKDPFIGNEAFDQDYITKRFMHQVQTDARITDKFSLNNILSYTDYSRRTRSTLVNKITGDERLALGDGMQDVTAFDAIVLRGTALYKVSPGLSFQPGYDINSESGSGGRIKDGEQKIDDFAFFLSSEISISKLNLRPGLRIIRNSVYEAPPVVPSLNAKVALSQLLDLRFSYGRGFRAPSLRELYFNFFDASHAVEGNPNLRAELSHSFNTALTWRVTHTVPWTWNIVTGGFYNDVNNLIATGFRSGNSNVTTYINVDKFKTIGGSLTNKLTWKNLETSFGFSYTGRYNRFDNDAGTLPDFTWSEEFNTNLTYHLPKTKTTLNLYYKYTGKLPYYEVVSTNNNEETIHQVKTSGFQWADFTINQTLAPLLTLTGGIRNLFDVERINNTSVNGGSHTAAGPQPIGYGRSYFLGLSFHWTKQ